MPNKCLVIEYAEEKMMENFFMFFLTHGDDLGRVVIPKEIRRTMRIREGDPSQITLERWERFCFGPSRHFLRGKAGDIPVHIDTCLFQSLGQIQLCIEIGRAHV